MSSIVKAYANRLNFSLSNELTSAFIESVRARASDNRPLIVFSVRAARWRS